MNKFIIYCLLFSLPFAEIEAKVPPHFIEAKRLLLGEMSRLNSKMGLIPLSFGGALAENIQTLQIVMECPIPLELEDARILYLSLLKDWISQVKRDIKVAPYMATNSITMSNFEFGVIFTDFDTLSSKESPKLACIQNHGNKVSYYYRNEDSKRLKSWLTEVYPSDGNMKIQDPLDLPSEG